MGDFVRQSMNQNRAVRVWVTLRAAFGMSELRVRKWCLTPFVFMKLTTGMMLVGMLLSLSAQAASFDCGKAKTKVEKLICSHEEVKELDGALAKVYRRVLKQPQHAARIRLKQHEWLKSRESCLEVRYQAKAERDGFDLCRSSAAVSQDEANRCAQHQCLKRRYRNRIAELYGRFGEHWRHKSWEVGKGDNISGEGYPVCRAYLNSLNSQPRPVLDKYGRIPAITEFNPAIKKLRHPLWEQIDPKSNLALIKEIPSLSRSEEERRLRDQELMSRLDRGEVVMKQTRIRLSKDDAPVLLARIDFGRITEITDSVGAILAEGGRYFYVVNEHTRKIDRRYGYSVDDVFIHDGNVYLTNQSKGRNQVVVEEPFSVPETGEKGSITVCVFEYLGQ